MRHNKKGVIWISAVIYVMVAVVVMVIALEAGLPLIENLTDRNAFSKIRDTMVGIDKQVQQIASEGQGSQRVIPLEIIDGELSVEDQKLRWKLETESKLVESQTRVKLGNLVIASDVDVTAQIVGDYFIVENSRIKINFSRIGEKTNFTDINTSALVNKVLFKDSDAETTGTFTFFINDSNSIIGNGYTVLEDTGSGLTSATVRAHLNNSAMEYDIVMTLDSKADFFKAGIENFEKK